MTKENLSAAVKKYNVDNINALKALANRYRSITAEEINAIDFDSVNPEAFGNYVTRVLTGFGNIEACSICKSVTIEDNVDCSKCFWQVRKESPVDLAECIRHSTYADINNSETTGELLYALRERAAFIEGSLMEEGL